MPAKTNPRPPSKALPAPQGGYVLLLVPVVLMGVLLLGTQMARRTQTSLRISGAEMHHVQTRLCNESLTAVEVNRAVRILEQGGEIPPVQRISQCSGDMSMRCTTDVRASDHQMKTGCYELSQFETVMPVRSRCRNGLGHSSLLDVDVRLGEFPLYQFAAFYNGYMAIHPGSEMRINGRVHSNDTLALDQEELLSLSNWITSPKAIIAKLRGTGRVAFAHMDGSGPDNVAIVNLSGTSYRELKSHIANWVTFKANHRIAYGKETNGCGPVQTLVLKNLKSLDARKLIEWREPADGASEKLLKYAWRANLIYKDGGWKTNSLAPVVPAVDPHATPAAPGGWAFTYPRRVRVYVRAELLMTHLIPINVATLLQRSPTDSIIYLHDEFPDPLQGNKIAGGFLLYNATALTRPVTIVSNSRIVTLGNYNTTANYSIPGGGTGYFPSALLGDHLIALTQQYVPTEHDQAGEGLGTNVYLRNAAPRIVLNTCLTIGGTKLADGHWQGVHLLPQHMEYLTDVPVTITGSLTCLFSSKWVTKVGVVGGDYRSPLRNFNYDPMYNDVRNMPPGTPRLVTPVLADWHLVRD